MISKYLAYTLLFESFYLAGILITWILSEIFKIKINWTIIVIMQGFFALVLWLMITGY